LDSFLKAKQYSFLLLKFRLRSEKELEERLKGKKFGLDIIRQTIAFLKEKKFLDDHIFARSWIESRLKKPLGLARLRQELKLKGIDSKIIEAQLEEAKKDYSEEETVLRLAKERLGKLKGIDAQKAKQRVYGYLLRRGFSGRAIIEAIEQLC